MELRAATGREAALHVLEGSSMLGSGTLAWEEPPSGPRFARGLVFGSLLSVPLWLVLGCLVVRLT